MSSNDEPQGHRGHPTFSEMRRAARVAERLAMVVTLLQEEGFKDREAISFLAGVAHDKAVHLGESWSTPAQARRTIEQVLGGRAAKEWSIDAIMAAILEVELLFK